MKNTLVVLAALLLLVTACGGNESPAPNASEGPVRDATSQPSAAPTVTRRRAPTPSPSATAELRPCSLSSEEAPHWQTGSSGDSKAAHTGPDLIFYVEKDEDLGELGDGGRLMAIRPDGSGKRQIAEGFQFAISPDASMVAYRDGISVGGSDEVRVVDVAQGTVLVRAPIRGYCDGFWVLSGFDWSPDSQRIAYSLAGYGLEGMEGACARPGAVQERPEDPGVYQIRVTDGSLMHFPMHVTYDAPIYKQNGSVLYLPESEIALDAETGGHVGLSFDADEFCPGDVRVGQCGREVPYHGQNLCLFDRGEQQVTQLTDYRSYEEIHPTSGEAVDRFRVFPDCSGIVYSTHRHMLPPITPDPEVAFETYGTTLHVMDIDGANDCLISTDVVGFVLSPGGHEIVFIDRPPHGTRGIQIADIQRKTKKRIDVRNVSNAVISPDSEEVAIAADGIYIVCIDGNDLRKIVDGPGLEVLDWR